LDLLIPCILDTKHNVCSRMYVPTVCMYVCYVCMYGTQILTVPIDTVHYLYIRIYTRRHSSFRLIFA
jgi:hypothetical protein